MPDPEPKLRVLHLRATNFYGGPERQLHRHALAVRNSPFEITIASFSEQGRSPDLLPMAAGDGIRTHLFTVASAYDRRAVGLIRQYLKDNRIAVFCTHDYRSTILGAFAVRGSGSRWIAFSRGRTTETFAIRLYFAVERMLMRFADAVVAVSDGERRALRRRFVPAAKIAVVHNAIDTAPFASIAPVDLRSRFGFPADSVVAVAAGRFSPEKGQAILVRAVALAVRQVPELRVVLYGDGPLLDAVRAQITAAGLDGRILCPGFEPHVARCLKGADFVVNPSLSEGLPNVLLEAMALRVPVVATAVGGVPELISDNSTGLLVPPGDPALLAENIIRLARDKTLRNSLAQSAFRLVDGSFSFDRQARELIRVYENVLKPAGGNP